MDPNNQPKPESDQQPTASGIPSLGGNSSPATAPAEAPSTLPAPPVEPELADTPPVVGSQSDPADLLRLASDEGLDMSSSSPTDNDSGIVAPSAMKSKRMPKKRLKITLISLVGVVILGIIGYGVFTLVSDSSESKQLSTSCVPTTATVDDQAALRQVYALAAKSLALNSQSCMDTISSSYFKNNQRITYGSADWISTSPGGLPSHSNDFKGLDTDFAADKFVIKDYYRPLGEDNELTDEQMKERLTGDEADGKELLYQVKMSQERKVYLAFGIVSEDGQLVVDQFRTYPVQMIDGSDEKH